MSAVEDRGLIVVRAIRERAALGETARNKKRIRKERDKPWEALRGSWERFLHAKYGIRVKLRPWGHPERNSARLLVSEYGFQKAEKMADAFVENWTGNELPSITYLWAARDSWSARAEGLLPDISVKRGEYSAKLDGASPKHGW